MPPPAGGRARGSGGAGFNHVLATPDSAEPAALLTDYAVVCER